MMMESPKKKASTIIVSAMLGKKPGDEGAGMMGEGDEGEGKDVALEAIAEDIIKAIAIKDPKALSMALSHFWYIADEDEDKEEGEEPGEGYEGGK